MTGPAVGHPLGDAAWLTDPDGPAHHTTPDRAPTAACGVDLSQAHQTTVTACQVFDVALCLTCFPSPSHLFKETDANKIDADKIDANDSETYRRPRHRRRTQATRQRLGRPLPQRRVDP